MQYGWRFTPIYIERMGGRLSVEKSRLALNLSRDL